MMTSCLVVPGLPAFMFIQKNASTCISEGFRRHYGVRAPTASISSANTWGKPLACMWRDPAARLESAYRMFRDRPDMAKDRNSKCPQADRMDFEPWVWQLLDIEDAGRDLHVASQSLQATDNYGEFMPTKVYKWDFDGIRADYGIPLDRRNESNPRIPCEWSPELVAAHRQAYAPDWEVWES